MEKLLYSKSGRRKFLVYATIILAGILLLRYWLMFGLQIQIKLIYKVLDDIFSAGLTTILISILVFWITPRIMNRSNMEVIAPYQIKERLDEGLKTNEYWYSGSTGRYTRAVTLPALASRSRTNNETIKVMIQILNPTDEKALEEYAKYRNSVRTGLKAHWSTERVRNEVYATITSIFIWKAKAPLLDIEISLTTHVSLFRYDLSSESLVITKEDPKEPALFCSKETFFHKSYREDLRLSHRQNHFYINFGEIELFKNTKVNKVKELIEILNLSDGKLTEKDFEEIFKTAIESKNPY